MKKVKPRKTAASSGTYSTGRSAITGRFVAASKSDKIVIRSAETGRIYKDTREASRRVCNTGDSSENKPKK